MATLCEGRKDKQWFEPLSTIILWGSAQIELKETLYTKYGASIQSASQRKQGVAYSYWNHDTAVSDATRALLMCREHRFLVIARGNLLLSK